VQDQRDHQQSQPPLRPATTSFCPQTTRCFLQATSLADHHPHRPCRPHRPRQVQGRHGGQLVGVGGRCQGSAVPRPERMRLGDDVDDVAPRDQAGRSQRHQPEHSKADHVDEHQRGAQWPVAVGVTPPQPTHHGKGDDEVGVVVVVRHPETEGVVGSQPVVHRRLGVEVDDPFGVPDAQRVVERGPFPQRGQAGHGVVEPQQPHHRQRLQVPPWPRSGAGNRLEESAQPATSRARRRGR
jgi:hypothetical protein